MREGYQGPFGFTRCLVSEQQRVTADVIQAAGAEVDIAQLVFTKNLATLRGSLLGQTLPDPHPAALAASGILQVDSGVLVRIKTTIVANNATATASVRFIHQVTPPVGAVIRSQVMSIVSVTAAAVHTWAKTSDFVLQIPTNIAASFTGNLIVATRWEPVGGNGQIRPVAAANIEGGEQRVEIWV